MDGHHLIILPPYNTLLPQMLDNMIRHKLDSYNQYPVYSLQLHKQHGKKFKKATIAFLCGLFE
jgi:hypothetical protein